MEEFLDALRDENGRLRQALPVEGASGLTVLDCHCGNVLLFSQGSWDLVRNDLLAAKLPTHLLAQLEDGPCAAVMDAFDLRRELVNYKKVLLHLYAEARRIEGDLQRGMAFTFWQDPDIGK